MKLRSQGCILRFFYIHRETATPSSPGTADLLGAKQHKALRAILPKKMGGGSTLARYQAPVRAPPFGRFYEYSLNYLSEIHGSLGSFGVPVNFRYSNTSAATNSNAAITLIPVENIAIIVAYEPSWSNA